MFFYNASVFRGSMTHSRRKHALCARKQKREYMVRFGGGVISAIEADVVQGVTTAIWQLHHRGIVGGRAVEELGATWGQHHRFKNVASPTLTTCCVRYLAA